MSGGCTNCGKKSGCDSRKHDMLAEVHETLGRLYPSRRWDERADEAALDQGVGDAEGQRLAQALSERLKAFALYKPGAPEDYSNYIFVLCFGRQPSILELREGIVPPEAFGLDAVGPSATIKEVYLRVSLSALAPFAAVQEVRMELTAAEPGPLGGAPAAWMLEQNLRAGVFDPLLLSRYQRLVAVLAEFGVRNVDFGEINEPPSGYEGAWHAANFGLPPTIANYLFYAGPTAGVSTEAVFVDRGNAAET